MTGEEPAAHPSHGGSGPWSPGQVREFWGYLKVELSAPVAGVGLGTSLVLAAVKFPLLIRGFE